MLNYLTAIGKWIFRKETLSQALFIARIYNHVFTDEKNKGLWKNQKLMKYMEAAERKLKIAQYILDKKEKMVTNDQTVEDARAINNDKNKKLFGDFEAFVEKDRFGAGNDGIRLGLKASLFGNDVKLGFSNDNKSISVGMGPIRFGLG